ncbi:MAG TPA: OmpH family outer membrane protein [Candidatus Hydrogenedentes bacterium]|nr:OmpH family outer membrane protein [Candidatus Hydrogenedentota bacterium]
MIPRTLIRYFSLIVVIAIASIPTIALAQNSQYKIGVVNLKIVFDEYDKQKEQYEVLKVEVDKLQKPIDDLSERITKDKETFDDETVNLTDEERDKLQDSIEADLSKYKAAIQQSQEEVDRREKRIFEEIIGDIQIAVEEVGALGNYHLVFDSSKNRNNNLLYFSTTLNMTQKVIDHLNNK